MVVAEVLGVAGAMGIVAWWSMRAVMRGRLELGLAAVAPAALVCFSLALVLAGPAGVTGPAAAALLGFALALAFGSGGDGGGADDEPPWWPSFERDFRRYDGSRVVRPRRG